MVVKLIAVGAAGALAAFVLAGPLQHLGVVPETAVGNASKVAIKTALNIGVKEAWGSCGGFGGGGNNGFGNGGFDGVPGNSGSAPGCAGCAADVDR